MCEVHRARHLKPGREAAVKVLPSEVTRIPSGCIASSAKRVPLRL